MLRITSTISSATPRNWNADGWLNFSPLHMFWRDHLHEFHNLLRDLRDRNAPNLLNDATWGLRG